MFNNPPEVVTAMISCDEHAILPSQELLGERLAGHAQMWVTAGARQHRNVGVMVADVRPLFDQEVHEFEARRFPGIVNIFLVRHSKDDDLTAVNRLSALIEGIGEFSDDIARHAGVDLACQFDELRGEAILPCYPSQIERIDRNTVVDSDPIARNETMIPLDLHGINRTWFDSFHGYYFCRGKSTVILPAHRRHFFQSILPKCR